MISHYEAAEILEIGKAHDVILGSSKCVQTLTIAIPAVSGMDNGR